MKKVLIIGATSSIAEHCARMWAERGYILYLVARNEEHVRTISNDLEVRGAAKVFFDCKDLNDNDSHKAIIDAAKNSMDGIDILLIAHGTLSDQKSCEQSVQETLSEIKTNALSTISLLTLIANVFEAQRCGVIAVISSVAGDRGRASNYVYGSAKAMINSFASGLRQRLQKSNVSVVTIKPGFVDTPMTHKFKKGMIWAKPTTVAAKIVSAIDLKKDEIYVPSFWMGVMLFIKAIPNTVFKRMEL